MGMRRVMELFVVGMGTLCACRVAVAADGSTTEAAAEPDSASQAQISQTIEATRAADPELAAEMERQLRLLEEGELRLQLPDESQGPPSSASVEPSQEGLLIEPPLDGGGSSQQDPLYEKVHADPRMQEIRSRFESGELTEDQARERMDEVLREYGIEPDHGREWERHHEGLDQAYEHAGEHIAPEAREQLEHLFEPEGAYRETEHRDEPFERANEATVREGGFSEPMHP